MTDPRPGQHVRAEVERGVRDPSGQMNPGPERTQRAGQPGAVDRLSARLPAAPAGGGLGPASAPAPPPERPSRLLTSAAAPPSSPRRPETTPDSPPASDQDCRSAAPEAVPGSTKASSRNSASGQTAPIAM